MNEQKLRNYIRSMILEGEEQPEEKKEPKKKEKKWNTIKLIPSRQGQ